MKVFLVPRYIKKENIPFYITASVEAEYGGEIIEGEVITLAHHIDKYKSFRAPCVQETPILDNDSNIVISHIDLDTLGGVASLMGIKKKDDAFWNACEYIDLFGPHHLNDLEEGIRNKIIAYNSYAAINHMDRVDDITDVTTVILDRINVINHILDNDDKLITEGLEFYKFEQSKIEDCLIYENPNIRVFYSKNGLFCNANYYSSKFKSIVPYVIVYNGFYNSLSLSSENGGKNMSCNRIMKELFGNEAGGHDGIAGSPRNQKMSFDDFKRLIMFVNDYLNKENNSDYMVEMDGCLRQEIKD